MIIAQRKPLNEIMNMLEREEKVLILGCRECVTVCFAGGEREVAEISSALRIGFKNQQKKIEIFESFDWGKVLALDSLFMFTERDEFFYHESLVHPLLSSIKNEGRKNPSFSKQIPPFKPKEKGLKSVNMLKTGLTS